MYKRFENFYNNHDFDLVYIGGRLFFSAVIPVIIIIVALCFKLI